MDDRQQIALFDRYLTNEMDSSEKQAFEERLKHSESLKNAFNDYVSFSKSISDGVEYKTIGDELKGIHDSLYTPPKRKRRILSITTRVAATVSLAAGIILIMYIVPFGTENNETAVTEEYQPLANYADDAGNKLDQFGDTDILYELPQEEMVSGKEDTIILNDTVPIIDQTPLGTAFLISNDGYFLTARHLVKGQDVAILQHKDLDLCFEVYVLYCDSILDLAILKCSPNLASNFDAVPYQLVKHRPELGEDVFTLGYPKKDIVYTEGVISSETGFHSDSMYFEVSLPSNIGNSGAPLFNEEGLVGLITANNAEKQSVTYVLGYDRIRRCIDSFDDGETINMQRNYSKRYTSREKLIKLYRSFIFEVH